MATTGMRFTDLSPAKRRRPKRLAVLMRAADAAIERSGAFLFGLILGRRLPEPRSPRPDALTGVFGAPVRLVGCPVRAASGAPVVGGARGLVPEKPNGSAAPR